ncbi:MAG: TonB family protein, partial [Deltaproteobacteria bacterium]|nr:TonB family protein [Deltaproteobacteria bacterium]
PPPPPPQPKVPPPELAKERFTPVEVDDDDHVVDEAPVDATYLSDKNRRVEKQSRAEDTNLEKESKGKHAASEKSDDLTSAEVGGKEEKIRQLEKAEASSPFAKRDDLASVHNGTKDKARGVRSGDDGPGGKGGEDGKPGLLSMRHAQELPVARGETGGSAPPAEAPGPAGRPGREGAPGSPGHKGPKLHLDSEQYERIVGKEKAREEAEVARRVMSHKRGRWEKKLAGIKSSLENFVPEVRPGNQTALSTRAAPFAVYIARMHRRIHESWAFSFLEDLNDKPRSNPMNDWNLKVTMEIVLLADGNVDKVTIARSSGVLTFDVAAIDTLLSAGPYGETPSAIRSGNGKVYMHWTFHRDPIYACHSSFADPFILDNAPVGSDDATTTRGLPGPENALSGRRRAPERLRREKGSPTEGGIELPRMRRVGETGDAPASARAIANLPTPDDPLVVELSLRVGDALEKGDVPGLVALSDSPFRSGGKIVGRDPTEIHDVWRHLVEESPQRRIKDWKPLSAAGYRAAFGHLPEGAQDGTPRVYLVVRTESETYTFELEPRASGYRVTGIYR